MVAFSIARPPCVLTIDAPELGLPFVPKVRRWSQTGFMAHVGGQARFNALMRAGEIVAVDHAVYDRRPVDRLFECEDVIKRRYLTLPLCVPLGLIVTARGSDSLHWNVRRLFIDKADGQRAACDVERNLRHMGAVIDGEAEPVSDGG